MTFPVREVSRVVAGFLGAPLASGFLMALMTLSPFGGFFALIFAYPFAWILGIPIYFLFRRFGWLKFWKIIPTGAVLGGISFALFYSFDPPTDLTVRGLVMCGIFMIHGAVVAGMFWFIAIKPRKFDLV